MSTTANATPAHPPKKPRVTLLCEWAGSLTGLLGSALLASKTDLAGYGFVAFLLSNIGWLYYSMRTRTWSLFVMQLGFTLTSVIGIRNWLFP